MTEIQYIQQLFGFTNDIHHEVYPFIDPKGSILKDSAAGKTVLITGCTRGIGKATAIAFALVGASKVIITGRTASALNDLKASIESQGSANVLVFAIDVTKEEDITKMFESLMADDSVPDILVNNAGRMEVAKPLADMSTMEHWATYETNLKGVYMVTKAFINARKDRGGTIINTSSIGAGSSTPDISAYQISKSAVNRFTEFTDIEYGKQGFRCFTFHPGGVVTALATTENIPQSVRDALIDPPELGAMTAVYLASDRTDYLKGRYISSNWDVEELEKRKEEILRKDLFKMRIILG